jgi:anti-sigma regulatory factor (Ser/Thr protein kinase)
MTVCSKLPMEPGSAAAARRVLDQLDGQFDAAKLETARLLVTEVVTNAVRHGAPGGVLLLAATPKPEFLCVQVTDDGPGLAPRPRALETDDNGGFGLFFVEQLTRRWGVTRENRRTRVWFELDYR